MPLSACVHETRLSYLRIPGLLDYHTLQGENYPKPLLNLNTGLGKIGEIPGTTMNYAKFNFMLMF